jgi:hypothetical protein
MSDLRIIAISVAAALVCFALARSAERRGKPRHFRFALLLMLAVAGWLIYFGVMLVQGGSEPPFATHPWIANIEDGRTALLLFIANNWAYAVILIGVAFALQACKQLLFSFWRPE